MYMLKYCLSITLILFASSQFLHAQWKLNNPTGTGDLVAIYFTSSEKGWVAGDNGYLASTNDGGRTWTRVVLGTTENINEIYFRNERNGYLVAGRKMFVTSDAGANWRETVIYRPADLRGGTPEFLSIRFADRKRGLVIGALHDRNGDVVDSLVMRTEDGGETWQRSLVPSKGELFHLDYNGSSNAWIVGDEGVILATTDSGISWTIQKSGTRVPLYCVDFRDDEEGYAVGKSGTILRTEDGGDTWTKVTTNFPDTFMRVDFADDKNGWIVGYRGSILRSSDKGRTWIKQESSTASHLYGLYITKKYGFAVGAKGAIVEYQR